MKFYVVRLHHFMGVQSAYPSSLIMSSHRFFSAALKKRDYYRKRDKRANRKSSYGIIRF